MSTMRKLRRMGLGAKYHVEPIKHQQLPFTKKMSEVLLDFAQPLLEKLGDEGFENGVSLAALCWNLIFLPIEEQCKLRKTMIDKLGKSDPRIRREFEDCINMLLERRKTLFADDRKMVVNFKVVDEGGSQRLLVMSTLMKDKLQIDTD